MTKLGGLDVQAFKYLIVHMNTEQRSMQFEILPTPTGDSFLERLDSSFELSRSTIETEAKLFLDRYKEWILDYAAQYEAAWEPPDGYSILSTATFDDNYYLMGDENWSLIALGNWERYMAPPSIVEFLLILIIGEAIALGCGDDWPTPHLATRGCPFDYNVSLEEARLAVLNGFLCSQCRTTILKHTSEQFCVDAETLLSKSWLGDSETPSAAAVTTRKLGYDLFHTKDVKPTFWERTRSTFEQEGISISLNFISKLAIVVILLWLGLDKILDYVP